jgi:pimeloyl-ACP methyl ester carboxylesterase
VRELAIELNFEILGEGTPVVLIHGFPFDHSLWEDVIPLLKEHARLILPDLRGFGKSPIPDGVYSMRLMAEDIAALLDKLNIQKAVLAGHSMGGYISLAFAHAYPDRVAGLALITSQAAADTPERRQGRYRLADEVKRKGVKAVVAANLERYSPDPAVRERARILMMKCQKKGVIAALKGMAERPDYTEALAQLHAPTVIVAGGADAIVSPERAGEMVQILSMGWGVEVPEGGHMPMYEAPQIVAKAILDLLAHIDNGKPGV